MLLRPPRSTRTYTLFPYTTLFRSPEAYLSTIACNLLRDRARIALSRSLALHIPTDEVPLAGHDPIAALEARDQIERLQASLARLSPKTRSIFLAHRREGMTYKEIANQPGLGVKAVGRRDRKSVVWGRGVKDRLDMGGG